MSAAKGHAAHNQANATIDVVDARRPGRSDAVVIGAGIGGLYAVHALTEAGFDVAGFELGSDVGGTWFWNRYPGARCDIESLEYSFQFDDELQQQWEWSERYAAQPELLAYANHIADRFDLRSRYSFETRIDRVWFDDSANEWQLTTACGRSWTATYVVMATGGISVARYPDIAGQERFGGRSVHTAEWPPEGVDVADKRVAMIGTGSSAIQALPELARTAAEVVVLQRSPNYVVPSQNATRDPAAEALVKASYREFRRNNDTYSNGFGTRWERSDASALSVSPAERERRFAAAWANGGFSFLFTFGDLTSDDDASETAGAFIRSRIADIVDDPVTADLLTPRHVFGCRRLCVGTNYYETFNEPNVRLVDVGSHPIQEVTATGVRYGDDDVSVDLDVDVLIYATGFEDQAASFVKVHVEGPGGVLADVWADQPSNYLGIGVAGFPNLFMVNMPGSPSIATNMMTNTEYTVDFIVAALRHAQRIGADRVDADPVAQAAWTDYVDTLGVGKVYNHCQNLYMGTTEDGRRYVLPHLGVPAYLERVRKEAVAGFPGMTFTSAADRPAHDCPDVGADAPASSRPIDATADDHESELARTQLEGVL